MSLPTLPSVEDSDRNSVELLYGRSSKLRVFISSEMRSGRLRRDRLATASVVDVHPDAEPWLWERHARAGSYSAFEVCVGTAKTSDILLLILGDDLTDVTEAEWRAAKGAGANCALLVKEVSARTQRAEAFIAAERRECIYAGYSDVSGLRQAVQDALRQCMTDAVRHRALARRSRDVGQGPMRMHLLEAGLERAERFLHTGAIEQAMEVLSAVDALVGAHDHAAAEDLDLITGLVAGAGGHVSKAVTAYLRIIRNKQSSKQAKALAYQNLGIEAMRAGQVKLAGQYMKSALGRHKAANDWFGVLQVVLNMGNLAIERADPDAATAFADLAEKLVPLFEPRVPIQRASVVSLRAGIAAHRGHNNKALNGFKAAHAAFKRLGEVDGQVVSCQNVAASYHELGRPALARRWVAKALQMAGDQGPTWRREEIHRLAGVIEYASGPLPEARRHFEEARALAGKMGDSWRVATLTADIGAVLAEMGSADASAELERARTLLEAEQDFDWLVRVGLNRAFIATCRGNVGDAIVLLEELTNLSQASRSFRSRAHERLAALQLEEEQPATAARNFKRALELQPKTPDSAIPAAIYAHQLQDAGAYKPALRLFDVALRRALTGDDVGLIHDAQSDRALLLAAMGNEVEALSELEACLEAARRCRDPERIVRGLHNIGELTRRLGDTRRSLKACREACTVAKRIGDEEAYRSAMGLLAMTQAALGRAVDAEKTASRLCGWARAARDQANESVALGVLGGCAFARLDYRQAADLYRAAARRNVDDPVHHAEDLCGIVESHAAAGRWRPTIRATQTLVSYAEAHGAEGLAWRSLARAARWYLDEGQQHRAGTLTMPAWVLARRSKSFLPRQSRRRSGDAIDDSEFMEAVVTTAFHELWSGTAPCDKLYGEVLRQLDLGPEDAAMRLLIEQARQSARDAA